MYLFCRLAADELVEAAALADCCLFLMQESEVVLVKLLEPLVPTDLRLCSPILAIAGKRKADDAGVFIVFRDGGGYRFRAALLRPPADFSMIGRHLRCCAGQSLLLKNFG
jgi:hypothetical protein